MSGLRRLLRIDLGLILTVAALSAFSVVVIASATRGDVAGHPLYYAQRQIMWIILGVLGTAAVASIDYREVRPLAAYVYAFTLLLLALVLVHGQSALGAQRWISLGPFQMQPSEFAKIGLTIGLADLLAQRRRLDRLRDLLVPIGFAAVPALLVFKQPDLGTALVFVAILVVMLFMAGARVLHLLLVFGGAFALMVLLIYLHVRHGVPLPFIHAYQLQRLLVFLDPTKYAQSSGYNIIQSLVSIGSGGLSGIGVHSNQAILTFLPEHSTDFIFAVVALDFGFVGGTAVLVCYLLMLWRGLSIVSDVRDQFGLLLGAGVAAMLGVQVMMNAGMAMGIMPVVGVPLPFVSYGGSSVLTDFLAIGVWLSLRLHPGRLTFRA